MVITITDKDRAHKWYPGFTLTKDPADTGVYAIKFSNIPAIAAFSVTNDKDLSITGTTSANVLTLTVTGGREGQTARITVAVGNPSPTLERSFYLKIEEL